MPEAVASRDGELIRYVVDTGTGRDITAARDAAAMSGDSTRRQHRDRLDGHQESAR
jgi:hypothetical protein